jgi:hypothetical protein
MLSGCFCTRALWKGDDSPAIVSDEKGKTEMCIEPNGLISIKDGGKISVFSTNRTSSAGRSSELLDVIRKGKAVNECTLIQCVVADFRYSRRASIGALQAVMKIPDEFANNVIQIQYHLKVVVVDKDRVSRDFPIEISNEQPSEDNKYESINSELIIKKWSGRGFWEVVGKISLTPFAIAGDVVVIATSPVWGVYWLLKYSEAMRGMSPT